MIFERLYGALFLSAHVGGRARLITFGRCFDLRVNQEKLLFKLVVVSHQDSGGKRELVESWPTTGHPNQSRLQCFGVLVLQQPVLLPHPVHHQQVGFRHVVLIWLNLGSGCVDKLIQRMGVKLLPVAGEEVIPNHIESNTADSSGIRPKQLPALPNFRHGINVTVDEAVELDPVSDVFIKLPVGIASDEIGNKVACEVAVALLGEMEVGQKVHALT